MPFPNANTNQSIQCPALVKSEKLINTVTGLSPQQNKCLNLSCLWLIKKADELDTGWFTVLFQPGLTYGLE